MTLPASSLAIANAFIEASPRGIDHMSLQKLTYLASGWWLAWRETPLCNELPEIWRYGPVYASLYHTLKHFRQTPITRVQSPSFLLSAPRLKTGEPRQMISWILSRYGTFRPDELSTLAHAPGTPWAQMAKRYGYRVPAGTVIPEPLLREHFRAEMRQLELAA